MVTGGYHGNQSHTHLQLLGGHYEPHSLPCDLLTPEWMGVATINNSHLLSN